jgi:hypothetical protein
MERSTIATLDSHQLFRLGHGFYVANCKKLPEGMSNYAVLYIAFSPTCLRCPSLSIRAGEFWTQGVKVRQGAGRGKRWNLGWILPWPWGYIQHIIKQNTTCDYWPPKAGCYDKWHCTEFCRHIRKDYLGIYHLFIDSKKITTTNMAMGPFTLAPWIFLCPQHAQDDVTSTWGSFDWQFIHFRLVWPPFFCKII